MLVGVVLADAPAVTNSAHRNRCRPTTMRLPFWLRCTVPCLAAAIFADRKSPPHVSAKGELPFRKPTQKEDVPSPLLLTLHKHGPAQTFAWLSTEVQPIALVPIRIALLPFADTPLNLPGSACPENCPFVVRDLSGTRAQPTHPDPFRKSRTTSPLVSFAHVLNLAGPGVYPDLICPGHTSALPASAKATCLLRRKHYEPWRMSSCSRQTPASSVQLASPAAILYLPVIVMIP